MPEVWVILLGDINSPWTYAPGYGEDISGGKMVKAYVPLSEMFGYSTDLHVPEPEGRGNYSVLRSMSQFQERSGEGSC